MFVTVILQQSTPSYNTNCTFTEKIIVMSITGNRSE